VANFREESGRAEEKVKDKRPQGERHRILLTPRGKGHRAQGTEHRAQGTEQEGLEFSN